MCLDLIILNSNGHIMLLVLTVHTCIMEYHYYYQGMLHLFKNSYVYVEFIFVKFIDHT
jgi:hypothetical protein